MKKPNWYELLKRAEKMDLGKMNKKKRIFLDVLMISVGMIWIFTGINLFLGKPSTSKAEYIDCIDGDTIKLRVDYKEESVRLLAVDTPEVPDDYYGNEASSYTCDLIMNAESIKLSYHGSKKEYDKYGRLLAWVFIDGSLLQENLVEGGYAKVAYLYKDYKYTEKLKELEFEAKNSEKGVWINK